MRFPRFRGEYIVDYVSFRENVAMRIGYVILATCCVQRIMPRLPLANCFSKCVSGPQNWYPGICNSKGSTFITQFNKPLSVNIHHSSLSMVPVEIRLMIR